MERILFHIVLIAAAALPLAGCGFADSHAPLPEFMRTKDSDPPPLEPPPNVKQIVREHLDSVFVAQSAPSNVQVSAARHDLRGPGWTACVKAELTSATGKPLGVETYRITINDGLIYDRRRAEDADNCVSESYEPI
ncbi:hypothetical protein [Bradyrhizobium sp. dw_78]|uniref:hypothetical protein n=1 Tax=Bradyrhizobium sp. dw_78 TaxID=2719793 RepID=UPI001BD6B400|nr:hypothetical protein [Bradyrhizobium sp. dw_78]